MNLNSVFISGLIKREPQYIFTRDNIQYFKTEIAVQRDSRTVDIIPATLPDSLILTVSAGAAVSVTGEYRSYNQGGRLKHYVLVKTTGLPMKENNNSIDIAAYVTKVPTKRVTQMGRRVADMFLAYNDRDGESSYIPAIIWGKGADDAEKMEVGTKVHITGRIQSREYEKD